MDKSPTKQKLNPADRLFIQGLIKPYIDYYRGLASHSLAGKSNHIKLKYYEDLYAKLSDHDNNNENGG